MASINYFKWNFIYILITAFFLFLIFLAVTGGFNKIGNKENLPEETPVSENIRTDYSEGNCTSPSDCKWAGEGCGGGHGICTDKPENYDGMVTTCDINNNFPNNQGYKCTCLKTSGKCGWVK